MGLRIDIEEEGKRRAVPFTGNEVTIGRGSDNSIVINDPRSSRHHCRVLRTPQGLLLEDRESRNGTLLDGTPVKKILIKPGARFSIGSVRFHVLEQDAAPAATAPARGARSASKKSEAVTAGASGSEDRGADGSEDRGADGSEDRGADGSEDRGADGSEDLLAGEGGEDLMLEGGDVGGDAEVDEADGAGERDEPPDTGLAGAFLERLDRGKAVERIPIEKASTRIGRGKDCDVVLADKRASSHHARVLVEGGALFVEDLGSTNGTLLNNRAVKRGRLAPGAVILVGNTGFRVILPAAAAQGGKLSRGEGSSGAGEEFVTFDAEKFLARDASQHPAAVFALVVILAVVCFFTVDITRRLVRRQDLDPRSDANRIAGNWSFENDLPGAEKTGRDSKTGKAGIIPGWRIAEGDRGTIRVTEDHAQHPGKSALLLAATGDDDICRASYEADIILDAGREYLLEGYAVNKGAFAAGLCVEWLRPSKAGAVEVGRSYSDTARQTGEAVDIAQTIVAPPSASQARVSCFVIGPNGSAVFDRLSFAAAPAAPSGAAPGALSSPGPELARLRAGTPEDPLFVSLLREGTFQVQRRKLPLLTALWVGLPLEEDPHAYGPRLASIRAGDGEAAVFTAEVPDEKDGRWVTVEARASVSGQDVQFQWRAATSEGESTRTFCLYLETRDKSVPFEIHSAPAPAPEGAGSAGAAGVKDSPAAEAQEPGRRWDSVKDIVVGEREDRVSLVFPLPVKVSAERHPMDAARQLLVVEGPPGGVDMALSHGSSHEASLARRLALEAEEGFRSGRAGEAIRILSTLKEKYPEEKAEIRRAEDRVEEWRKAAADDLKAIEAELAVLRQTPTPVVRKILLERAEAARARYEGTAQGAAAGDVIEEVKKLWAGLEARRADEELRAMVESARKHFAAGELGLAELFFRWVAESDKEGALRREAESTLKIIEGRRTRDRNILLQ